jgi:uncharacterized protein with PIN domain
MNQGYIAQRIAASSDECILEMLKLMGQDNDTETVFIRCLLCQEYLTRHKENVEKEIQSKFS